MRAYIASTLGVRRREAEAAVADHLGGDALEDLRARVGVDGQREVAVRMHVDEAGSDDLPAQVEDLVGREAGLAGLADLGDAVVLDEEIARPRGRAGPVDEPRAGKKETPGHRGIVLAPARESLAPTTWTARLARSTTAAAE